MNVLVIPEDFRRDEPLLQPLVRKLLSSALGRRCQVQVCRDPLLGGVSEALKWTRLQGILRQYRYYCDLFVLIVDRDGEAGRAARLRELERLAAAELPAGQLLLAEHAWQEIEVWALAGVRDLPRAWSWAAIRQEPHAKEVYFEPYIRQRGLGDAPFQGRAILGVEAARSYRRVRTKCPEDVQALERRIKAWRA